MSIKTNCELPLCLMEKNNELNNYDFVLFHLYISNKEYREYFLNQRVEHPDRLMILDNSAYEFYVKGETLDLNHYLKVILELKPDLYILPDVLMNKDKTLQLTKAFLIEFSDQITESKPLSVLQGNTPENLIECLEEYNKLNIKNIAVPFHNKFLFELGKTVDPFTKEAFDKWHGRRGITPDAQYAMGRIKFLTTLRSKLNDIDHLHILGSHDPFEKVIYNMWDWKDLVITMDTGYPVKCGIKGILLGSEESKPDVIIDEFLEEDLPQNIKECIEHNVAVFRDL